jgi:hypothetical protein
VVVKTKTARVLSCAAIAMVTAVLVIIMTGAV